MCSSSYSLRKIKKKWSRISDAEKIYEIWFSPKRLESNTYSVKKNQGNVYNRAKKPGKVLVGIKKVGKNFLQKFGLLFVHEIEIFLSIVILLCMKILITVRNRECEYRRLDRLQWANETAALYMYLRFVKIILHFFPLVKSPSWDKMR